MAILAEIKDKKIKKAKERLSPRERAARKRAKAKRKRDAAMKPTRPSRAKVSAPKFYRLDLTGLPGMGDFIQATSRNGAVKHMLPGYEEVEYKPEFDEQATGVALLGKSYSEIAEFFGISPTKLVKWMDEYPSFAMAVKRGMDQADMPVVIALRKRAVGFTQETPGPYLIGRDGEPVIDPITGMPMRQLIVQYFPPDTAAASKWLGSRQRKVWGDVSKVESVNTTIQAQSVQEARKALEEIFNAPPDLPPEIK